MTKKLRTRFVFFAMIALIIMQLLILLFTSNNSRRNLTQKADTIIDTIYAAYPEEPKVDARYFVAFIGKDKSGNELDMSHISSVKSKQAKDYISYALESGTTEGFIDSFRFRIFHETNGLRIIFLSRSYSIAATKNTLLSSCVFSAVALSFMSVILIITSYWVTKPIGIAYQKQQQFVTAASHELSTPLSVIKVDTDILHMDDPENEWLIDIQKQLHYLTELTGRLTSLAMLDEQKAALEKIPFPISDLSSEIVHSYKGVALTREINFSHSIEPNITYQGEMNFVRALITILLDNAFKYCPKDGTVHFCMQQHKNGVQLMVSNTNNMVTKEELPQLSERFYRSPKATESALKGYGLGLSIADSIVKYHKGRITPTILSNGDLQFLIVLK